MKALLTELGAQDPTLLQSVLAFADALNKETQALDGRDRIEGL